MRIFNRKPIEENNAATQANLVQYLTHASPSVRAFFKMFMQLLGDGILSEIAFSIEEAHETNLITKEYRGFYYIEVDFEVNAFRYYVSFQTTKTRYLLGIGKQRLPDSLEVNFSIEDLSEAIRSYKEQK